MLTNVFPNNCQQIAYVESLNVHCFRVFRLNLFPFNEYNNLTGWVQFVFPSLFHSSSVGRTNISPCLVVIVFEDIWYINRSNCRFNIAISAAKYFCHELFRFFGKSLTITHHLNCKYSIILSECVSRETKWFPVPNRILYEGHRQRILYICGIQFPICYDILDDILEFGQFFTRHIFHQKLQQYTENKNASISYSVPIIMKWLFVRSSNCITYRSQMRMHSTTKIHRNYCEK